ncbi:hypothetical protein [Nocardioides caldifontis]|uniref:hypothetical protein n=1 Tax=Nocardioides caldifontis TaxID=2588938 RepID=UPI00193A5B80|nr:hypothetical protein [Nocardioides caldifontis]
MTDDSPVLVTGAFGNVGRHTLRALLADAAALDELVSSVAPRAVLHLAAMIPPATYLRPELAAA